MDQSLKQRLVGAIVLISLAVIFLPLVFDGQQQRVNSQDYEYPEEPAMTIKAADFEPIKAEAESVIAEVEAVEAAKARQDEETLKNPSPEAGDPVAATQEEPATVAEYVAAEKEVDRKVRSEPEAPIDLADAWIMQVGAFSSQANANGLRDKLIATGYKAYSKKVGALYKVYVGPEIRKHRLEQQKNNLERDYKVKALILKYIP